MQEKIAVQRSIVEEKGGVFGKYLKRVVGTRNIFYFLKYEFLNILLINCPSSLGLFLRQIFYPSLFSKTGKGVQFGFNLILRGVLKANIGAGTILDDFVVIDCKSELNPGISIGEKCLVARNTKLSTGYTGYVKVGNHTIIGENCIIHGPGGIEIGDNVLISDGVLINAGLHVYSDPDKTILSQGITLKGIKIGNDVWIGTGSIIKDGVTVGDGCVIEAGSVVGNSIPDYTIASGVPAKVIAVRR